MYRMRSLECALARFVPVHEAHIRAFRIRYNKGRKGRFMGVSDIWLTSIVDGRDCWPADGDRYGRACSPLGSATTLPSRAMKLPGKRSVRRVAEMPTISLGAFNWSLEDPFRVAPQHQPRHRSGYHRRKADQPLLPKIKAEIETLRQQTGVGSTINDVSR